MIITKHEECVKEMERRGYNHKSPLPEDSQDYIDSFIERHGVSGEVDYEFDLNDLRCRCPECARLQEMYGVI